MASPPRVRGEATAGRLPGASGLKQTETAHIHVMPAASCSTACVALTSAREFYGASMLPPGWREDCGAFTFRFSDVTTASVQFGKWKERTKAQHLGRPITTSPSLHFLPESSSLPPPHRNTVSHYIDTFSSLRTDLVLYFIKTSAPVNTSKPSS